MTSSVGPMKLVLRLSLLLLALSPVARAQGPNGPVFAGTGPVYEGGIGYSYMGTSIPSNGSSLGMNGILLSGDADFTWHLGVKLEAGYSRAFDAFSSGHSADMLTYMGGPVFFPVRHRNFSVSAQALFGGARETGVNANNNGGILLGFASKFAWSGGVGLQYRFTPALSFRLEGDYLRTTFYNTNMVFVGQNNVRSSLSVIYTFGHRE